MCLFPAVSSVPSAYHHAWHMSTKGAVQVFWSPAQILALGPSLALFSLSVAEQGLIVGPFWRVPLEHGTLEGAGL